MKMPKHLMLSTIAFIAAATFSPMLRAQGTPSKWNSDTQTPPPPTADAGATKKQNSAPAPPRDLSGTWDAGGGAGIQAFGAKNMPSDGKPEHDLPFTPLGLEALNRTKPGFGVREVPAALVNDPVDFCDPQGFPREDLYELRTSQIFQTPTKIAILYQFDQIWRVIWTDGRELPKDPEPRWFGYSVGKWVDDYTFLAETNGLDERTWLDNAGRPHSDALRVQEQFHRVDHDTLELTVTINDPKFYTKPWVALDKFPLHLRAADFDVREMICSPSETSEYNKQIGDPVGPAGK